MSNSSTVIELPFTRLQEMAIQLMAKAEGLSMEDWILKTVRNELVDNQMSESEDRTQPLQKLANE